MPLYEYVCREHGKFERLRRMSEFSEPSDCPRCNKESSRVLSAMHFRMAEPFRVVDSQGNITQEQQVTKSVPDWQEQKPIEPATGVPVPIISRGGNVYYPRRRSAAVDAIHSSVGG